MKLIEQDPILKILEEQVDRLSVGIVLQALVTVCEGKAEDEKNPRGALFWDRLAEKISNFAEDVVDIECQEVVCHETK